MIDLDAIRPAELERCDPAGMHEVIAGLHRQSVQAMALTEQSAAVVPARSYRAAVVCGMGGSAIAGDLLAALAQGSAPFPIAVNRNYGLPGWVGRDDLVIVSSYSGDTEETLSAFAAAEERGATIAAITSGGELDRRCRQGGHPCLVIPGGLPPRGALGFLFFGLLGTLLRSQLIPDCRGDVMETIQQLEALTKEYEPSSPAAANRAKTLALQLHGGIPIVYASADGMAGAARRWANQLNENAKVLSYWALFPELCHNEIVGWEKLPELRRQARVVFLEDRGDHPRNALRARIVKEVLNASAAGLFTVQSRGDSLLARMFSLICLGDWTSLYLAYLHQTDPTPVARIAELKNRLRDAR